MADCVCGTPVQWAEDVVSGEKVKLEKFTTTAGFRYREVGFAPLKVQPVDSGYHAPGYPAHDCERRP